MKEWGPVFGRRYVDPEDFLEAKQERLRAERRARRQAEIVRAKAIVKAELLRTNSKNQPSEQMILNVLFADSRFKHLF